jgi:hypothetical protein
MQHPLIHDLSGKSLEDLQNIMTDLMKKLNFAYQMQNSQMIHQISMALDSYRTEYSKQMDELIKKQSGKTTIKVEKEGEIGRKD